MLTLKRFSPSFFIGTISIGTVEGASCVNLGNNLPSGFVNYKKHNQGFGSISGDHNDIHEILATLDENGINDAFHYGPGDENEQEMNQFSKEILNSDLEIENQNETENQSEEDSSSL